jgi:hypothetical protein
MRLSNVPNEVRQYEEPEREILEIAADIIANTEAFDGAQAVLMPKFYDAAYTGQVSHDGGLVGFNYDYEKCIQLAMDEVPGLTRQFAQDEIVVVMKAFAEGCSPVLV